MALHCTSTKIPVQKYGLVHRKTATTEFMSKCNSVTFKMPPRVLRISASINNKIYEDESEGIVCYEDESGEIICEGYDEGSRFQRTSRPTYHPRDAEIMNLLLQQSWLQIVKGEEINHPLEGASLQEDLQWF